MKRQLAALALGAFLFTVPAQAAVLTLDGAPLDAGETPIYENTTFVSLRNMAQKLLPGSSVRWEDGQAVVQTGNLTLTAQPGDDALVCNGSRVALRQPVRLEEGRTLVPVRTLAGLLGLEVSWNAVGNVVLNRVKSPDFPDTIYGVIFDDRWGGQFEPVRNGTVYNEPTQESIRAAIACLEGANVVGDSLYFLAPHLTDNHWTMENRTWTATIGAHWFYE